MATTDLATVQEVKDILEITGSAKDTVLAALVSAASLRLERWCKVPLIQRAFTERHGGGRIAGSRGSSKRIWLRNYPIVSVASVVDEGSSVQTLVENTDFYVDKELGLLEHYASFPAPYKGNLLGEWVITHTAGRWAATASVTADAKLACALAVADSLARKTPSATSMGIGGLSMSFSDSGDFGLPADVRSIMSSYKGNRI